MNEVITLALDHADRIRTIYKEVSGSVKPDDWYPISVVCENCGRIGTTRTYAWDGTEISYKCEPAMVKWAVGCGHEGKTSPYDGRAKLPWKVEWAAKWRVMNVAVEGAGKDHSTKGGSREVAERISREVFLYEPPVDVPYEFFLVGGAKMSSSKGKGASAREVADLLPPVLFRLLLTGTPPLRAINIDPEGEALPTLFDWYDEIAGKFWAGTADDDARLFEIIHHGKPPVQHFLARFSTVAFLTQMAHVDIYSEFGKLKGGPLTADEVNSLNVRVEYAKKWLAEYAPEKYKFEVQQSVPEGAKALDAAQKSALAEVEKFVAANPDISGEALHSELHEIRKRAGLEAKAFFSALYLSILGKESGPQAGWFLTTLDRDFLLARLKEVSA
jgi:lysyl-tRNA synthetase class 1